MWIRAQNCIAQDVLTNSKHPRSHVNGIYPKQVRGGVGSHLYDLDNNKYLDYICGLGANLVGYGNETVNAAIIKNLYGGFSHSFPTHHEVECAEKLKQIFTFVDKFKFLKSGSEACTAAIRIARSATGRDVVLSEGYHGWHDDFVGLTPPASGVPKRDFVKTLKSLKDVTKKVAAVIVEPVIVDNSRERIEWLKALKERCDETGVILIFDEVITGFRYKDYSCASNFNIYPDLIIIGKAMANGLPLAAVGGKKEIMDGNYFISSTYAGEVLSLVACQAVVDLMQRKSDFNINYLWAEGQHFIDEFNKFLPEKIKIVGYPTRGVFEGDELTRALFFQECAKARILFCKSWFYNFAHISHNEEVLAYIEQILFKIKQGNVQLEGDMPSSPFAMKVRENGQG